MKKTKYCDLSTFKNETFTFPIAKRKVGQEDSDTLVPKKFIKLQEEKLNLKKDNVTLNKTVKRKTSCAKILKYKYKKKRMLGKQVEVCKQISKFDMFKHSVD